MESSKKKLILILVAVGFIVYFNSLFNGFLWDDEEVVVNNPMVRSVANIPLFFLGQSGDPSGSINQSTFYYRPIMTSVNSILYSIGFGRPFVFRLFQVLVHLTNAVLIFLIFDYFFEQSLLSFFLALTFLVHPGTSEAVFFTSANQEALFFLIGITAFLFLTKNKNILVSSLIIFSALFVKETALIFFALVLFYLLFFERKILFKYSIIVFLFFGLFIMVRLLMGSTYIASQGLFPIMRVSHFVRLLTIPKIILFYLRALFFPKDLGIAQHWVVKSIDLNSFFLPLTIDVLFFLLLVFYFVKTKNKVFAFFFMWFLLGLLPHLQLIPLNMTAAERWMYFPLVGLLGMAGVAIAKLKVKNEKLKVVFAVIIILFSIRTFIRSFDWRNGLTLFSRDAKKSGNSFDLENNLGVEQFRSGQMEEAKIHFERSAELAPYWWVNWNNLGVVYERKKNLEKAEEYYLKSINNGDYYLAYENYAGILIREKKSDRAKKFLEERALKKFPNSVKLRSYYYFLLTNRQ